MKKFSEIKFEPIFSKELPADTLSKNGSRIVEEACFSLVNPKLPSNPKFVHLSSDLCEALGIQLSEEEAITYLSGSERVPSEAFNSFSMCYGGHQFGQWAGQLGDGRAIIIGESFINNRPFQFQLKGAGPTPYSRRADGFAVLRSSIREYLCSEAMHHLGIPTTRALSIVTTGDLLIRDMLYDGNPQKEIGAVVCRTAESFIRFGNFEIFAARNDLKNLKKLVDFTINHHFTELGNPSKETYIEFFREVVWRTKDLIIHWQRAGFVHGVMNTDNMSIHGLTIDYGPYGWLENYDHDWTPNTTDLGSKRYRFGNQPNIALWNLVQLANALYLLVEEAKPFEEILEEYKTEFHRDYKSMMLSKLGLYDHSIPKEFIAHTEEFLHKNELDYTLFFRLISETEISTSNFDSVLMESSYLSQKDLEKNHNYNREWMISYMDYIRNENIDWVIRSTKMQATNPRYVLRNYMAQLAIDDANKGQYGLIYELYQMLRLPYTKQEKYEKWFAKRPDWAKNKVGCSMLSCSS